jgi:hypothetical protein
MLQTTAEIRKINTSSTNECLAAVLMLKLNEAWEPSTQARGIHVILAWTSDEREIATFPSTTLK